MASLEAVLRFSDVGECFFLELSNGAKVDIIWPEGSSVAGDHEGIALPDQVEVKVGDGLILGGGYVRRAAREAACVEDSSEAYFASSVSSQ
jgi:hypothetical protein